MMFHSINTGRAANQPMPGIFFWAMAAMFKIRDWLEPRSKLLDEIIVNTGDTVLDFGCGPGSYVLELAKRVGTDGTVIAVDIHPLAIQSVEALNRQHDLHNVRTYLMDGVNLPHISDNSVNTVLLFDVFHMLGDQKGVLAELQRVLHPAGILAVHDPHMDRDELVQGVTRTRYFKHIESDKYVTIFKPIPFTGERGMSR
jgi:ubiquinone/menaquinone biosynthesis C-methylase UbiE